MNNFFGKRLSLYRRKEQNSNLFTFKQYNYESPAYVSIEMIAAAMGGKTVTWPVGTYVHSHGFDHIMMAMETKITKDGVHTKGHFILFFLKKSCDIKKSIYLCTRKPKMVP